MKSPFSTLLRATRMARRGRPLSALLAFNTLLAPGPQAPKPKRKAAAPRAKIARPPAPKPAAKGGAPALPRLRLPRLIRPAPGSFIDGSFTGDHGTLAYKLYTPLGSARRRLPLIVMLHGCSQSASDFATGTRMNHLADELAFLVLYPEQSRAANMGRCWNWHRPGDQERGGGEPATIAALARQVIGTSRADPARVYIAGLSAGGAAAAIVGAAYPDLFVAVGVHSGLARGTVSTVSEAVGAMRHGSGARPASTARTSPPPPLIVFHGDQDNVVNPCNARRFLSELRLADHGALSERTVKGHGQGNGPGGRAFTRTVYKRGRDVVLEGWIVHGSGHAWSGGSAGGSYTDPAGPDASREMTRFFLARRRQPAAT